MQQLTCNQIKLINNIRKEYNGFLALTYKDQVTFYHDDQDGIKRILPDQILELDSDLNILN